MRHVYQDQTIGGADILNSLADVNIGNPEDGQMLVYDASTQRWRNVTQKSLNDLAEVTDLTDIIATGTTNATGATIPNGTYFYLNDDLCQAKADIASGATFTENTNYEEVTAGGLNALNSKTLQHIDSDWIELQTLTWAARTGCWTTSQTLQSVFGTTGIESVQVVGYTGVPCMVMLDGMSVVIVTWAGSAPNGRIKIRGIKTKLG